MREATIRLDLTTGEVHPGDTNLVAEMVERLMCVPGFVAHQLPDGSVNYYKSALYTCSCGVTVYQVLDENGIDWWYRHGENEEHRLFQSKDDLIDGTARDLDDWIAEAHRYLGV